MNQPLVSVICLCYNHALYVRKAVESVLEQTYTNLQIIVVDDASKDKSASEINQLHSENPKLEILLLPGNVGNCKAFNIALSEARGAFIIDFATDDIMMPDRIEKQVQCFAGLDETVGVVFTDARYINEEGDILRDHFAYLLRKRLIAHVPVGDIYKDLVSTYFIPSPTMMVRREVFEQLAGYDENLSYEDFDFWIRSSRTFRYAFLDEKLTLIRKVKQSMSTGWYVPGDQQLHSTYLVCRKIRELNRSHDDDHALIRRVRYEFRQSVFSGNFGEAEDFFSLLKELGGVRQVDKIFFFINRHQVRLSFWRNLYHKIRFS